jgi:hypothetical protein
LRTPLCCVAAPCVAAPCVAAPCVAAPCVAAPCATNAAAAAAKMHNVLRILCCACATHNSGKKESDEVD